jgi:hypothetical protein
MLIAKHMLSDKHCQGRLLDFLVDSRVTSRHMAKKKDKDPHAVYLGRLGGKARTKKLSAEQRQEIARKAAQARWAKKGTTDHK